MFPIRNKDDYEGMIHHMLRGGACYPLDDPLGATSIRELSGMYPGTKSATGVTLQSAGPTLAGTACRAAAFDGAVGTVSISSLAPIFRGLTAQTISFWALGSAYAQDKMCLSIRAGTNPAKLLGFYPYDTSSGNGLRIIYNNTSIININSGAPTSGWNHFAYIQYSATSHEAFVNGVSVATSATSKTQDSGLDNVNIGCWYPTQQHIAASLAHVAIIPAALSAAEIYMLYKAQP